MSEFRRLVESILPSAQTIQLDLSECTYIDGPGLRVLEDAARADGHTVGLKANPVVWRLLEILQIQGRFQKLTD